MNYIFGYGSLLSAYSREHYSGIHCSVKTATLNGWSRSWCATYTDEGATYAGALPMVGKQLDGVLIASDVNEDIAERERGYRFVRVGIDDLSFQHTDIELDDNDQIWICETLSESSPTHANPLPQSYIDTCVSGCIESCGTEAAIRFIQQTCGWDCVWVNDRHLNGTPIYPRYTPITRRQANQIDSLLNQQGVLKFRRS